MARNTRGNAAKQRQANARAPTMIGTSPGTTPKTFCHISGSAHAAQSTKGTTPAMVPTSQITSLKPHSAAPLRCSQRYASQELIAKMRGKTATANVKTNANLVTATATGTSHTRLGMAMSTKTPTAGGTSMNAALQGTPAKPHEAFRYKGMSLRAKKSKASSATSSLASVGTKPKARMRTATFPLTVLRSLSTAQAASRILKASALISIFALSLAHQRMKHVSVKPQPA
mmetsp:Transcript_6184/g.19829  ORF Transcript_6184/g.19829 Transcript_6184/m.19829 type:complete len:229 (+) Transcript_6184:187-873(+)